MLRQSSLRRSESKADLPRVESYPCSFATDDADSHARPGHGPNLILSRQWRGGCAASDRCAEFGRISYGVGGAGVGGAGVVDGRSPNGSGAGGAGAGAAGGVVVAGGANGSACGAAGAGAEAAGGVVVAGSPNGS